MELQVFVSKKGTKVVSATDLHLALELPKQHYAQNVKKWLNDIYEFHDGIRKPLKMRDFADRKVKGVAIIDDYYLSVELAKLITLGSKSKLKQKYAKWLFSLENKVESAELLNKEQIQAVLELAKVMGLMSCQESSEKQHLRTYESRNGGQANNWWKYRSEVVGYSADQLRKQSNIAGKNPKGKNQRQLLMQLDKFEIIRTGVIDWFMGMGKSMQFARNMGDLAKLFAKELKVEIHDDRKAMDAFAPGVNLELMAQVKNGSKESLASLW